MKFHKRKESLQEKGSLRQNPEESPILRAGSQHLGPMEREGERMRPEEGERYTDYNITPITANLASQFMSVQEKCVGCQRRPVRGGAGAELCPPSVDLLLKALQLGA